MSLVSKTGTIAGISVLDSGKGYRKQRRWVFGAEPGRSGFKVARTVASDQDRISYLKFMWHHCGSWIVLFSLQFPSVFSDQF